jgi:hypothetical protein
LLYLAGVSVGLFWFLLGFVVLTWLIARSTEPSAAVQAFYCELIRSLGRTLPAPRLRVTPRVTRPVLAGMIRPCILVPPRYVAEPLDRESLRIILLHELAHARQGDSRFSAVASLAQSLWFFLPFLWWLRVQLRGDQEFLADRQAAEFNGSPTGYASRLVGFAPSPDEPTMRRPILDSVSLISEDWRTGGFRSQLLQRVVMLLHCPYPVELAPPRWWSLLAPPLALGFAVLCSSIDLTEAVGETAIAGSTTQRGGSTNRFQVPQFVASAQVMTRSGRSIHYVLPLPLPEKWDLTVAVQASPSALNRIRIAGVAIGTSDPPVPASTEHKFADPSPSWHQVHLRRDGPQVLLEVDGQALARSPKADPPSDWLTVEPAPDENAVLRNLVVTW